MSSNPPSDPTAAYYEAHGERFVADTVGVDMTALYGPFAALLPSGGHVLDAGCGSGRDAIAFASMGFRVTAFDSSPAMAKAAHRATGLPVRVLGFQNLDYGPEFDGVWACASLLHVPRAQLDGVFERLAMALKPGGVLYASFKVGTNEGVRDGRFFRDLDEPGLGDLLRPRPELKVIRVWRTADQRPERSSQQWLNSLVRKEILHETPTGTHPSDAPPVRGD